MPVPYCAAYNAAKYRQTLDVPLPWARQHGFDRELFTPILPYGSKVFQAKKKHSDCAVFASKKPPIYSMLILFLHFYFFTVVTHSQVPQVFSFERPARSFNTLDPFELWDEVELNLN